MEPNTRYHCWLLFNNVEICLEFILFIWKVSHFSTITSNKLHSFSHRRHILFNFQPFYILLNAMHQQHLIYWTVEPLHQHRIDSALLLNAISFVLEKLYAEITIYIIFNGHSEEYTRISQKWELKKPRSCYFHFQSVQPEKMWWWKCTEHKT